MSISIRAGDIEADRTGVVDLCASSLNPSYDTARYDWLYRDNPAGAGRLWVAIDNGTGQIAGTAGAFPRRVTFRDRATLGWVLGDFCVSESFRSLGPALALQRACLTGLAAGPGTLYYDFPGPKMMPVYQRLGIAVAGHIRRLAWPLKADVKIRSLMGESTLARGLTRVANAGLAIRSRPPRSSDGLDVAVHHGDCTDEFSALAIQASSSFGLCVQRTAQYLNWRYLRNPFQHHAIVTARRDDRLLGYAVIVDEPEADQGAIVDLFGNLDPSAIALVIRGALHALRERGAAVASLWLPDAHPWKPVLQRLGFGPREVSPVVLHDLDGGRTAPPPGQWFLTCGDRDG